MHGTVRRTSAMLTALAALPTLAAVRDVGPFGGHSLAAQEAETEASPSWAATILGAEAAASGAFVCEATVDGNRWSGVCFQPALATMLNVQETIELGPNFDARLCRALKQRGEEVPLGSTEVYAAGELREGRSLPDSLTVYHLLYFPDATEADLGVTKEDPGDGSPWLHHEGECTAHVMWSERRPTSE